MRYHFTVEASQIIIYISTAIFILQPPKCRKRGINGTEINTHTNITHLIHKLNMVEIKKIGMR